MKCENCHVNEAIIHITKGSGFEKFDKYLCESCANESFKGEISQLDEPFNIHELLKSLSNYQRGNYSERRVKRCETCGSTLDNIIQHAKFGCGDCYSTFNGPAKEMIMRVQSNQSEHVGKVPEKSMAHMKTKKELERLKKRLDELVSEQAFEDAVIVRDKIKELEAGDGHEG